jgi:hypothetical protein
MRVLLVRMAVYGCVLAIGLLVWQARSNRAPAAKEPSGGTVMQGTTLDATAGPVTVVARGGLVRSITFAPQRPCADVAASSMSPAFDERVQGFDRRGRRFRSTHSFQYPLDAGGWIPLQTVTVEGELSEDGARTSGTLTSSTTWWRNGVAGSSCRSTLVKWRAART